MNETREKLRELVRKHVRRKSDTPIRLTSGSETYEYFDGKQVTLFPDRMALFARLVLENVDLKKIQAIGGMSTGADPIAAAVSLIAFLEKKINIPAFFVRKEPKKHGLQKRIEGAELKKGMRVLIVEDVITKGSSTLDAIQAVEACGAIVEKVICLIDREEGGSQLIASKYPFEAIFKKSDLTS